MEQTTKTYIDSVIDEFNHIYGRIANLARLNHTITLFFTNGLERPIYLGEVVFDLECVDQMADYRRMAVERLTGYR